jgi:hypothetical protein
MYMTTTHWLELWTPLSAYQSAQRLFLTRGPVGQPRSLLKVREQQQAGDPNWFDIDDTLEAYEAVIPKLAKLGIGSNQASLWLSCQHEDLTTEVTLDPLALMRLSELDLKLCWEAYQVEWGGVGGKSPHQGVPVNVRDLGSELVADAVGDARRVWVSLDDDTLWEARFTTYQEMQWQWAVSEGPVKVGAYWQPGVVVVPDFREDTLEWAVADLLRRGKFEQAFSCLAGEVIPAQHLAQPQLRLEILHHGQAISALSSLSTVLGGEAQGRPNLWATAQDCHAGHLPQQTQQWVAEIQARMPALQADGIQRNDLSLVWTVPYQQRAHLELTPAVMASLAAQGMSLRLQGLAQPEVPLRCLDE